MSNIFRPLRRVNKVYTPNNVNTFLTDNANVVSNSPGGFQSVLNNPRTVNVGNNNVLAGYNLGNNNFISTADMNSVMRNNDTSQIRRTFGNNVTDNDLTGLSRMRQSENIPDARFNSAELRKDSVKTSNPSTNTTTPEGVQNVLNNNPQLNRHLSNLKTAGYIGLTGVGVYLAFSAATLVQDIIEAINRTGGSYYVVGENGGEAATTCLLRHRTCHNTHIGEDVNICTRDPLITDASQLNAICHGFDYEVEKTVCRASNPNADVATPQYVDISELLPHQTIMCIEPYNMGDLIGDLGLGGLLGEEGLVNKSSNKSQSISDSLLPVLLIIGVILIVVFIGYFMFKRLGSGSGGMNLQPIPTQVAPITVPIRTVAA
ncbi:occlusion derived viral protein-e56 [Helicoverpa armigera multiple nucleopolyhedrovirus]|uniref:Odv-e56 n=2 Tax=Alphabaculovirus TaxID=558016 RepID=I3XM24_NPVMB|nr:putative ODVP-E6/ODV-E56 [Mamestra configurata nucleopolyhedrovirus B]YP_009011071.1 odv-e56 [Mamestra brassicae multiple nucleopolyhedrovirus]ACH88528.1 occlusion derived viral protein-e56 [Helicoverpa armigera multiple nucleopolyhedrovirus]WNA17385.1 odv-e56 [Alphabaculovirus mabrassicae]AAM94993.1 putative ODVP-E6/ODV-E56 [Mamestra configurata nucleopolyhedrovirus B]AFL64857.1 odv-e56 [Mamestra brassicae multiple nucleopolyhedrovirus]AFP95725.1 odv-e56 [Mamestra brassicae multiple nucle